MTNITEKICPDCGTEPIPTDQFYRFNKNSRCQFSKYCKTHYQKRYQVRDRIQITGTPILSQSKRVDNKCKFFKMINGLPKCLNPAVLEISKNKIIIECQSGSKENAECCLLG